MTPTALADAIIEAHRTGGIDADLVLASWTVPDPVRFGEQLHALSPTAFDELHTLRQTYRPETSWDRENARLQAQAEPAPFTFDDYKQFRRDVADGTWDDTGEWDLEPPIDDGNWPIADRDAIAAVLAGTWEPPTPTILKRTDGQALLYPGKVHSLSGEPGSGKTWIALAAIVEVLTAGGRACLIDHEDRLDTAVRRLRALGAADNDILDRFAYITPTFALKGGGVPINVLEASAGADLVVIDSLGEALAHSQLSQNDDGEVAGYMDRVARRLADGGSAVLLLDHVTKDKEGRGRWAIGSQRKLAAIDGAAYMAVTLKALSKDEDGTYKVTCSKDRGGNYQHGSTVAICHFTLDGDAIDTAINPDTATQDGDDFAPTHLMEQVSKYLEMELEPSSQADITDNVTGKATYVRKAIAELVKAGYVTRTKGQRGAYLHTSAKSYREGDPLHQPVETLSETPSNDLVPTSSPPRPDEVRTPSERPRPSSPPFRGDEDEVGGSENAQTTSPHDLVRDEVNDTTTLDDGYPDDVLS